MADIFDTMQDGVYALDRRRSITFWNRASERISGWPPSELMDRSCADRLMYLSKRSGGNTVSI